MTSSSDDSTTPTNTAAYLPVTHCRPVRYREAVLSSAKFLETYWQLWDPGCSLRFVTAWHDGQLTLGYESAADDPASARHLLESLRTMLRTIQPWLGVGDVADTAPWGRPGEIHTSFSSARAESSLITATHSLAWRDGAGHRGSWHVIVDLLAPEEWTAAGPFVLDQGAPRDEDAAVGFSVTNSARLEGAVARVTLHGVGRDGDTLAALLSSDCAADSRLLAHRAGAATATDLGTSMPGSLLAHLLATPSRVGSLLPEHTPAAPVALFERLEAAPTPHTLLIGASGQGKSTALAAIGARALAAGDSVVAVDVHDGAFLHRLVGAAAASGRPALFIDCTPRPGRAAPALRLVDVPDGTTPDQHVENLWTMLRHDVWADMPAEFFGPVGQRITRAALALAVKDPRAEFGLSGFAELIDPASVGIREALLRRIGDADLTRVIVREVMPMVTAKDPDNSSSWIVSKFDPLGAPVVRPILEGRTLKVPLEEALARGWSLFLHAPVGPLGEDAARTIAAVFLHRVWAARRRQPGPTDLVLLLDELQKYASRLTSTMLAESRKFGMRVVAAHQNLAQLAAPIRESLLANTGAIGCYRLGPADASIVNGLFPTVPLSTLQTLPRHTLALTTFESDIVTAGPEPLPAPAGEPAAWETQLWEFWGGPEPHDDGILTGDDDGEEASGWPTLDTDDRLESLLARIRRP